MGYHRGLPCYRVTVLPDTLSPFPTLLQTERGHAVWHALWGERGAESARDYWYMKRLMLRLGVFSNGSLRSSILLMWL